MNRFSGGDLTVRARVADKALVSQRIAAMNNRGKGSSTEPSGSVG
jgi:hypothetical protein